MTLTVMIVAAEASGDILGAGLARALKRRLGNDVRLVGVGGPRMAEEGIDSPFDIAELSIIGVFEALSAYRRVMRRVRDAAALAAEEKPDVAVLIDSWGYTLRVAQHLRRARPDMPIVKYVGPQVWAWRAGRARTLARAVDHLLSIHAFDAPYFEREGLKTTPVGNTALIKDFSAADPARLRARIGAGPDDQILLLVPGSRRSELRRVAPPLADAAGILKASHPGLKVVIPAASTQLEAVRAFAASLPFETHVIEDEAGKADAMVAAAAALACSGTVTTELALAGCPMAVGYRIDELTYRVVKPLVKAKWITLMNIAAARTVVPEFIQHDCNGPTMAGYVARFLDDEAFRAAQVEAQTAAIARMGPRDGDPGERAADAVLKLLTDRAG